MPVGGEHGHASLARLARGLGKQARLPDARLAAEHERLATRRDLVQERGQEPLLVHAAEKGGVASSRSVPAITRLILPRRARRDMRRVGVDLHPSTVTQMATDAIAFLECDAPQQERSSSRSTFTPIPQLRRPRPAGQARRSRRDLGRRGPGVAVVKRSSTTSRRGILARELCSTSETSWRSLRASRTGKPAGYWWRRISSSFCRA